MTTTTKIKRKNACECNAFLVIFIIVVFWLSIVGYRLRLRRLDLHTYHAGQLGSYKVGFKFYFYLQSSCPAWSWVVLQL